MNGQNQPSKISKTALQAAKLGRASIQIAKGASLGGIHGMAVAAIKEGLPIIIKACCIVIATLALFAYLVFAAIPNIFFGFDSLNSLDMSTVTYNALSLGKTYLDLKELEMQEFDSVVTQLTDQYLQQGVAIGQVEIVSNIDESDLYWLIAIASVSQSQDLSHNSGSYAQALGINRIVHEHSLFDLTNGVGAGKLLHIEFYAKQPEQLMSELDFDQEMVDWSSILYQTLSESNALEQYEDMFSISNPGFDGDSDYDGEILTGGAKSTELDLSGFVSPDTKNNLDLAAYAISAWENGWGYVWGTYGNVLTPSLLKYKIEQYPDGVGDKETFIRNNWLNGRTTDCMGLIKGYGWLNTSNLKIEYGTNGMPDYTADQTFHSADISGSIATMPDMPGIAVWKPGHIGVYIGNGYVIEAMSTVKGVVKTQLEGRGWQGWCEVPSIDYQ